MVIEIKGLPEKFDSLHDKWDFLTEFYQELLALSDRLDTDTISFIGEQKTLH
jgi:hypothetical protein